MDDLIARLEQAALRHFYLIAAFAGCIACYLLHRNGYDAFALLGASLMLLSAGDRVDDERAARIAALKAHRGDRD